MIEKLSKYSDRNLLTFFSLTALLFTFPMILWQRWPGPDSCVYYVPMIQAFMNFDWNHAYYPMVPPGFSTIAGILGFLLSLDAFTASKLTASLFFAATVFPVFFIHKKMFNKNVAVTAVILFLFCSTFLRFAGSGFLTTGKTFLLVLTVYSLLCFSEQKKWRYVAIFVIGITGLSLLRPEGILVGAFLFIYFILFDVFKKNDSKTRLTFPTKSIAVVILSSLLCLPWMVYEYNTVGYSVLDSRQIRAIEKLFPESVKTLIKNPSPSLKQEAPLFPDSGYDLYTQALSEIMQESPWNRVFLPILKGFFLFYLLFTIPAVYFRIKQHEWQSRDTIILSIILIHSILMIVILEGFWTSKRYIIPAMPLMLGWTAIGFMSVLKFLKNRFKRQFLINIILILIGVILLWDGTKKIRPSLKPARKAKDLNTIECATWLRQKSAKLLPTDWSPLESTSKSYHNGSKPIIITPLLDVGYLANAEIIQTDLYKKDYSLSDLIRLCQFKKVNFIVLDQELENICPELKGFSGHSQFFDLMYKASHQAYPVQILSFRPNIKPAT